MPLIKTMTIDGFYTKEHADQITAATYYLKYNETDFGKQIDNFNLVPEDANSLFSSAFNLNLSVIEEDSGVFRIPQRFIHFEGFDGPDEWLFVTALQESTFNIFEHKSGATSALDGYKFSYQNLFDWDLTVNYVLKPGQGVLFRPWLFHSFDTGLIQLFRLKEHEKL